MEDFKQENVKKNFEFALIVSGVVYLAYHRYEQIFTLVNFWVRNKVYNV